LNPRDVRNDASEPEQSDEPASLQSAEEQKRAPGKTHRAERVDP
jgi:hypothetical protein